MDLKQQDNSKTQSAQTEFFPEENCHVEVSERDWQTIVQTSESDEVNPALMRAAQRYATRHK